MAAPGRTRPGRRDGRRSLPLARWVPTSGIRVFLAFTCLVLIPGCTWWREGRDSLAYSQGLYRRALESESQGDHSDAVKLLRASVTASPDDPELRWELARILLDHGETNDALQELRFLVQNYPDDARAYMSLARTLLDRNRPEDAARLADLAIAVDSHSAEALLLRGQIAEVRGDVELARETYHQILLEQPELAEVRLRLANLELEQGESRLAAAFLRDTLANYPLTPEQHGAAQWLLGTAYARDERWTEAAAALAIGIPATNATSRQHYELAYACYHAGNRNRAMQELAVVLRTEPAYEPAREMLADLTPARPLLPRPHTAVVPAGHSQ